MRNVLLRTAVASAGYHDVSERRYYMLVVPASPILNETPTGLWSWMSICGAKVN